MENVIVQVVDIVLFCLDQDRLKKRNLLELFPPFSRCWVVHRVQLSIYPIAFAGSPTSAIQLSPSVWLWGLAMGRWLFMT